MDIEETASAMFSRCMADGHAVASVPDRHMADALRAELRRLGRRFSARIATVHDDDAGSVLVARRDSMPWDPSEAQVAEAVARYILGDAPD